MFVRGGLGVKPINPMPRCHSRLCAAPAVDEYHWYQEITGYEGPATVEVVWELCEDHCNFALEVVEFISSLDEGVESEDL